MLDTCIVLALARVGDMEFFCAFSILVKDFETRSVAGRCDGCKVDILTLLPSNTYLPCESFLGCL